MIWREGGAGQRYVCHEDGNEEKDRPRSSGGDEQNAHEKEREDSDIRVWRISLVVKGEMYV